MATRIGSPSANATRRTAQLRPCELARLGRRRAETAHDGRGGGAVSFARPLARGPVVTARKISPERNDRHGEALAEHREALVRIGDGLAMLAHVRYRHPCRVCAIAPRVVGASGARRFGPPP